MSKKRIAELSTLVTANATQFNSELARADNAAKRHGAAIRHEMSHMQEHIAKNFTASKFAHGLIASFGIGSGAAAVEMIIEKIGHVFHEAAEDAKKFTEYVQESLKATRELSEERLRGFVEEKNPGQGAAAIEQRLEVLKAQKEAAEKSRAEAIGDLGEIGKMPFGALMGTLFDPTHGKYGWGGQKMGGDKAQAAEQAAFEDTERLQKAIEHWEKVLRDIKEKKMPEAIDKALKEFFDPIDEASKKWHEKMEKMAEQFKTKVATPSEKLMETLQDLSDLYNQQRIDETTLDRAQKQALDKYEKDVTPNMSRWEKAMGIVKPDEMTRRGMGSGGNYESVVAKQSSVLGEIRDILRRAMAGGYAPNYSE